MRQLVFLLFSLVSLTLYSQTQEEIETINSIPQTHEIFHYWDMDLWDAAGGGGMPEGEWHDMDFRCNPKAEHENLHWELEIGNNNNYIKSTKLLLKDHKIIYPTWDDGNTNGENVIYFQSHYVPTYYKIRFYEKGGKVELDGFRIEGQINNLDQYLYDWYNYYESEILSFSAEVDWQTGDINLSTEILQPEEFYITIKVNGLTIPDYSDPRILMVSSYGWERIKTINKNTVTGNHDFSNFYISKTWLEQNNLSGVLPIHIYVKSRMWGDDGWWITNPVYKFVYIDTNPTPSTPTISMNGGIGSNPTLTFSGGGLNVDHYVLKKEYNFGSGYYPHYVNPATNTYTDPNIEITRFGGDVTARYSVKAIGPTGIESSYSNTVSTNGNSLWKGKGENNSVNAVKEYRLSSNYPNPFNPSTIISYQIPKDGFVNLTVYNSLGQVVKTLVNEQKSMGKYSVKFNANDLPSGVYVYKLQANEFSSTKKMLLTK